MLIKWRACIRVRVVELKFYIAVFFNVKINNSANRYSSAFIRVIANPVFNIAIRIAELTSYAVMSRIRNRATKAALKFDRIKASKLCANIAFKFIAATLRNKVQ